jgi:hypothetical protein
MLDFKLIHYRHLLERLEAFEDRVGVRLDALSAEIRDDTLWVEGEVRRVDGDPLIQTILFIVVDAYDQNGRVISRDVRGVISTDFLQGVATFSKPTRAVPCEIAKIRIYPKPTTETL